MVEFEGGIYQVGADSECSSIPRNVCKRLLVCLSGASYRAAGRESKMIKFYLKRGIVYQKRGILH